MDHGQQKMFDILLQDHLAYSKFWSLQQVGLTQRDVHRYHYSGELALIFKGRLEVPKVGQFLSAAQRVKRSGIFPVIHMDLASSNARKTQCL